MSLVGYQDYWIAGSRLFFTRNDDANGAFVDLGTMGTITPSIDVTNVELYDSWAGGGTGLLVDEATTRINRSYAVQLYNWSPYNLSLLHLANVPESYTQPSGGAITAVAHKAVIGPGKFVKIKDSSGNNVYNVASAVVSDGSTSYTLDTDWRWPTNGKDVGYIEIISGGDISDGDTIYITPTLTAMTGNRLIRPNTAARAIKGKALIEYAREGSTRRNVVEFNASITPTGESIPQDEFASFDLTVKQLTDAAAVNPAGRILAYKGTLPA